MNSSRFPASIHGRGEEPDPRFSLANERTFLAWIRTSLALVAAGVALEALNLPLAPPLRFAAAVVFVGLGLISAAQAWVGWYRAERALRAGRALPGPTTGPVLTGGVIVAIILIGAGLALR